MAGHKKSVLNFSVQDASAALPQNCQTTKWILGVLLVGVNVTLVTREEVPVKSGIVMRTELGEKHQRFCHVAPALVVVQVSSALVVSLPC
jgi:hypothetical protein